MKCASARSRKRAKICERRVNEPKRSAAWFTVPDSLVKIRSIFSIPKLVCRLFVGHGCGRRCGCFVFYGVDVFHYALVIRSQDQRCPGIGKRFLKFALPCCRPRQTYLKTRIKRIQPRCALVSSRGFGISVFDV